MNICPICKSQGTLRRGHVAAAVPDARYFVVCHRCGAQFSVPAHEYFQLPCWRRQYSRQDGRAARCAQDVAS